MTIHHYCQVYVCVCVCVCVIVAFILTWKGPCIYFLKFSHILNKLYIYELKALDKLEKVYSMKFLFSEKKVVFR